MLSPLFGSFVLYLHGRRKTASCVTRKTHLPWGCPQPLSVFCPPYKRIDTFRTSISYGVSETHQPFFQREQNRTGVLDMSPGKAGWVRHKTLERPRRSGSRTRDLTRAPSECCPRFNFRGWLRCAVLRCACGGRRYTTSCLSELGMRCDVSRTRSKKKEKKALRFDTTKRAYKKKKKLEQLTRGCLHI